MRRLGIVDIGSNTIRLAVFARHSSGGFSLHDDMRERVRLGAGVGATGRIEEARLDRALELLAQFADYGRGARLDDLEVFGTSALRDADNGEVLVRRARELGLVVRVLSGEDEARYGVLAVANGFDLDDAWVLDLGGGSAQLSRMENRRFASGSAHPLGAVRLSEQFLTGDPPKPRQVRALEAAVERELGAVAAAMVEQAGPLVAIGGAVRNLSRAVQIATGYPLDVLHGYWLRAKDLAALTDQLLATDQAGRAAIRGIDSERADVIHAAAVVFRWLVERTRRDGLLVSGGGVREGALYRHVLRPPHLVLRVGASAVEGLVEQHVIDRDHALQVRRTSLRVFDALAPSLGLEPRDRVLLGAAAALHECGLSVHYYRRQKHGAFLLQAKALEGFTHREQALLMLMVRYHRKGRAKLGNWQQLLEKGDKERLAGLIACLRLAIALDRSRGGRFPEVDLVVKSKRAVLRLPIEDEASVELKAVRAVAGDIGVALGRPLVVQPVVRARPKPDPRTRPVYGGG